MTSRLHSLEDALRAIEEGTFGRCSSCDDEIPLRRLEAPKSAPSPKTLMHPIFS